MRIGYGVLTALFGLFIAIVISAPYFFKDLEFSKVLYSRENKLLGAKISKDGQWRFPATKSVPENYAQCIVNYEDKRFYAHIGIDPLSVLRAIYQNYKTGEIKSGGSTITMQLARLLLGNPKRSIFNKIKESLLAVGIEFNLNKSEILNWYTSLAPYGGNVVGLNAALWRYFQRDEIELSWAEAALLSVLPNQPSYIHLEKNRKLLYLKRNRLLNLLFSKGIIDKSLYELSILEEIPDKIFNMPQVSNLLLSYLISKYPQKHQFNTTIDASIQTKFSDISIKYTKAFKQNEIHNLAILLVSNQTGEVLSYLANSSDTSKTLRNTKVNNIHSLRSSGSVLKPLLFAAALDRGIISTKQLLPDIPTLISGFRPENYSRMFQGCVPADQCIQQSLNVPAVRLLQQYGVPLFYDKLKALGFTSLFRPSSDYGLALILGGAEIKLWDLANVYGNLANQLIVFQNSKALSVRNWNMHILSHDSDAMKSETFANSISKSLASVLSLGAISLMIQTMMGTEMSNDQSANFYNSKSNKIAWKTGTSFGFKDAWCVGLCPEYTAVVWVGNSSGLGRPGLIGLHTAAPLMFELIGQLNCSATWPIPYGEMHPIAVCKTSGYLPSPDCEEIDTIWNPIKINELDVCPYHHSYYVDESEKYRIFYDCDLKGHLKNYFVLPPVMESYYKINNPGYVSIPPVRNDCRSFQDQRINKMEFVYPDKGTEVFIPVDLTDNTQKIVLKATHKDNQAHIHWFIDGVYLGSTDANPHEWAIDPKIGKHQIYIMDDTGESATVTINCHKR